MSDLISRQAALDALASYIYNLYKVVVGEMLPAEDCRNAAESVIGELPPVQPERIKGHWIEITSRNHTYKCSVCGRLLVNITDGKNNVAKNYPYCHCGADMRTKETDCDYERAVEQLEHDMLYEPTFNPDDGSM